jgi:hypothetical protein
MVGIAIKARAITPVGQPVRLSVPEIAQAYPKCAAPFFG